MQTARKNYYAINKPKYQANMKRYYVLQHINDPDHEFHLSQDEVNRIVEESKHIKLGPPIKYTSDDDRKAALIEQRKQAMNRYAEKQKMKNSYKKEARRLLKINVKYLMK